MDVARVRLFLEVAEAGSLSKVAARRQTAQSHVSRRIAEFEAQVGGLLFRRTGRGVALTELGVRTGARLRAWLDETDRLGDELRAIPAGCSASFDSGSCRRRASPDDPGVRTTAGAPSGIRLDIAEAQGAELDAMLDGAAVDLAVLVRFQRPSGAAEKHLGVAHTYLVSAPGDPLTASATIGFSRLAGLRLVLPRRPSHWRHTLDETAHGLGFRLDAVARPTRSPCRSSWSHTPRACTRSSGPMPSQRTSAPAGCGRAA
jgi:DNA-binding transcriptional LysR family regulator